MSKLMLPSEMAHQVVGMLQPKARPFGVLCVDQLNQVFVKKGMCSADELILMTYLTNCWENVLRTPEMMRLELGSTHAVNHLVRAALMSGFMFRGEVDRNRWVEGDSFEMYRDAVREVA